MATDNPALSAMRLWRLWISGRLVGVALSPMLPQLRLVNGSPARSKQGHGSRACYVSGCREASCRAANARYMADYRHGLRGTPDRRMGPYRLDATP